MVHSNTHAAQKHEGKGTKHLTHTSLDDFYMRVRAEYISVCTEINPRNKDNWS